MNRLKEKICLKDLLSYIFKRWFVLLLMIITCGGLFGFLLDKIHEQGDTNADRILEYGLSDSEISDVYDMIQLYYGCQKKYEDEFEHYDTSILKKIDPYHIPEMTCIYRIDSESEEDVKSICQKYRLGLVDADTYELIREKTGWTCDNDAISDLISIDYDLNQYSGLVVTVIATSQDECKAIMEVLDKRINDYYSELLAEYSYTVNKDDERIKIVSNPDLSKKQQDILGRFITYRQYMIGIGGYLATTAQKEYYSYLIEFSNGIINEGTDEEYIKAVADARYDDLVVLLDQRVSDSRNKRNELEKAYFNTKNMLLGALFGFFLSVVYLVVRYTLTSTGLVIKNHDKEI